MDCFFSVLAAQTRESPTYSHVVKSVVDQSEVFLVVTLVLLVNGDPVIEPFSKPSQSLGYDCLCQPNKLLSCLSLFQLGNFSVQFSY